MAAELSIGPVSTMPFDDRQMARLRLQIQGIEPPRFQQPEEVVQFLGAMQSQEYVLAKWSIIQRAAGVDEAAVDRAVAAGTILRTHVLRPTWHFVRDEDIWWMLDLTAPRVRAMMASYDRKLELDDQLYAKSNEIIARAVEGGNHRTRKELADALARGGIPAVGQRLGHIVMRAELDAIVCSGVPRGKQNSYALLAERAPRARSVSRDEALGMLAERYFTSHGPATIKDFRWWSSLTAADANRSIEIAGRALTYVRVSERDGWMGASVAPTELPPSTAHLLQGYDEYIVGYTETRTLLDVAGNGAAVPGRLPFTHAIILDGQVVARWRRQLRPSAVKIEAVFLRPLERRERAAVEDAVHRYGRFVGLPTELAL